MELIRCRSLEFGRGFGTENVYTSHHETGKDTLANIQEYSSPV